MDSTTELELVESLLMCIKTVVSSGNMKENNTGLYYHIVEGITDLRSAIQKDESHLKNDENDPHKNGEL